MPIGRALLRVCVCAGSLLSLSSQPAFAQAVGALPSPWASRDLGSPWPAGSAVFVQSAFHLSGSGTDIGGVSDQFRFVYQTISGDVDLIARIDALTSTNLSAKAGVMIRSALTADAAHAFATVPADKGVAFQRRAQTGGSTATTAGVGGRAPLWLRLLRIGASVTAMSSPDGATWTTIGTDSVAFGTTVYAGFAVTSRSTGALAFVDVSNVAVMPISLPPGLKAADIGSPAVRGTTSYMQGVYAVTGAGTDIWDTEDQFQFVWQPIAGDVEIVARVASLTAIDEWTKAGVMIRESLAAGSRHAMVVVTGSEGYAFQRRIQTGGFSDSAGGGPNPMPAWIRLVRSGSTFEAFRSSDGHSWTSFARDTVPMTEAAYVGLAVTSHDETRAATAIFDNVTVNRPSAVPNRPPVITMTSPVSGSRFASPATIVLSANASDPEGRLARVDFYSGGMRIGTDSDAPFSVDWTGVPPGTYSIVAVAIDAEGSIAASPAATIDVGAPGTTPTAPPPPTGTPTLPQPTPAPLPPPPAPEPPAPPAPVPSPPMPTFPPPPIPTPTGPIDPPTLVIFTKSSDDGLVATYRLDVFACDVNPNVATPIASTDLGKPTPNASGDMTVNRAAFFADLPPGTYLTTVTAVGKTTSLGEGRSAPVLLIR